ncbi:MAG: prephenate dehydratase [Candidatus Poribacteria bacterium]|nr:prephenate dehydratase [Candidatus Poribacteria bacterium]MYK19417.1 prephenate dehydratase [Candidatus Poribacteria bacterium]
MELTKYRDQINEIDDQILRLLQKRAKISKQVGAAKAETGGAQVYVPNRQKMIIERLKAQNQGEFPETALEAIWTEILSASRSLQESERVAFLGPVGSFGHVAALSHFGASTELVPVRPQADIFTEVETGRADYGVVAIENSVQGTVRDVLERFQRTPLWICAETFQPIKQHLLSKASLTEIRCVYSHPQPFAQCKTWLSRYLSNAEQVEVVSTSEAARRAAQEPAAAAIASELASEIYQVPIVANSIMDEPDNTTRFFVIGKCMPDPSGYDRTSLFFAIPDKIGALHQALGILDQAQLNLSYLESLPSRTKPWEYIFFAEMEGHIADERVIVALAQLKELCREVNVLGSYPRGTL